MMLALLAALAPLSLLSPPAAAQAPPGDDAPRGALISVEGDRLVLALEQGAPQPGRAVAIYAAARRVDPRSGEVVEGLRYAGDGRITWAGPGLVEIQRGVSDALPPGTAVVLGPALGLVAAPRWAPEPEVVVDEGSPEPAGDEVSVAEVSGSEAAVVGEAERVARERAPAGPGFDLSGARLGRVQDAPVYGDRRQGLRASAGVANDAWGSGAAIGAVAWRARPARGPGLVEIGLEGLQGRRWLEGSGEEDYALEPAVSYRIFARVDSPGVGLALIAGLGAGVDAEGLAPSATFGLRTGHPDRSRAELTWTWRGELGDRAQLDGRVALGEGLRIGARAGIGDLPRHDGDLRQLRADGAGLLSLDLGPALTLELAAGAVGYDLLWADAGPVLDGGVEVRW
jgi:hypothetical protein